MESDIDVNRKGFIKDYGSVYDVVDSYGDVVQHRAFKDSILK